MHSRTHVGLVLLASLSASLLPAQAAGAGGEKHRTETAKAAPFAEHNAAWQQFLDAAGGEWVVQWCAATGTPKAIYGSGLNVAGWQENSLAEARRHAQQLLRDQEDLLGLGTSEFRETIGSRMGRTWALVYDQYFRGLPVIGGRADVRVHMIGRISMFGSTAFPVPANFVTVPQLGELAATNIAWQAIGQIPTAVPQPGAQRFPRLVIWGDVTAERRSAMVLAWEIPISAVSADGQGPIGRSYIDANTGAPLSYTNDKHECRAGCTLHSGDKVAGDESAPSPAVLPPSTGTVMAWTRLGTSSLSPLTNIPLPGVRVNVPGVGVVVTNSNGQFIANIANNTSVTVTLAGIHSQLIVGASAPSVTQTLIAGGSTTFQFLTAGATESQAAHTATYDWVYRMNEFCRTVLGNSPQLNTADNVLSTVNIASTCNAFYTGNTLNFYASGGGCNNTAYSSVVAHEWGHGLDDLYGGISQTNGQSESWGDICSMYLLDYAIVGQDFTTTGGFIRDGNNTRQYPTGTGVHEEGESWMGFAWKLRDRLAISLGRPAAITVTNTIVLGSIVANAQNQQDATLEVFLADDNDANLSNGTPHSAELIWACNQHSLPLPGGLSGLPNNDCAGALTVANGLNGPYTSLGSSTSAPAWPCATGGNDVWFRYPVATTGTLIVDTCGQALFDTAIQIFSGGCGSLVSLGCNDDVCSTQSSLTVAVTAGVYYIRVGGYNGATGNFSLNVSGPGGGSPASSTPFGTGCYRSSKAFYENFATAASFDLSGVGMRLVKTGDLYAVQAGGSYVTPTGATPLSLGDDAEISVNLSGSFPYPGGTTTSLRVCSNGFVSIASGNGTDYAPVVATWLGSVQPRWGSWHDYNPSATGSGSVKFQQIGSIAYVTWDGVYDFGQTTPNTWQLQFNLSNGNVTCVWQSMSGLGTTGHLVGYAGSAPNDDLGSMDLSVALPGGFRTGAYNLQPLALASTLPQLGSSLVFTTTQYPPNSALGIQVLSFIQHNPGLDLTSFGLPGCRQFTGTEVTAVVLPVAAQTALSVTIPNNPGFLGVNINSQTWALSPNANSIGLINSNGVGTVVGL